MRLLEPDGIPPDLAARGWLYHNPNLAERVGPDGIMDAWIDTRTKIRRGRQWYAVWGGYCNRPLRRSTINYLGPVNMMHAVECDESRGPLSNEWEGQTGAPQFFDWTHESSAEASRVVPPCGGWPAHGCPASSGRIWGMRRCATKRRSAASPSRVKTGSCGSILLPKRYLQPWRRLGLAATGLTTSY